MKRIISAFGVLVMILLLHINVFAYDVADGFICYYEAEKLPLNTKYIDLLLPIPSDCDGYIACNDENCTLFQIPQNSEIVSYCEDGFVSYTFHMVDANSEMGLRYTVDFSFPVDFYERHGDIISRLSLLDVMETQFHNEYDEHNMSADEEGQAVYYVQKSISCDTDADKAAHELFHLLDEECKAKHYTVQNGGVHFNCSSLFDDDSYYQGERESRYDYEYCRATYKKAKMAYIDEKGNVLAVTNAVNLNSQMSIIPSDLMLELSGTQLESSFTHSPFAIFALLELIPIFVRSILVILLIAVIVLFIGYLLYLLYRKKRTKLV